MTHDSKSTLIKLTAPGIAGLRPYEPGKPIEALEREYGVSNSIKLASNENPLGPGPLAIDAAAESLKHTARYPDGNVFALREKLSDRLGVSPEQLTFGNGSNEVLELVTRTFVTPANEVVFSEHAFAVYPIVTQAVGAKGVVVPACQGNNGGGMPYGNDLVAMRGAINEKTRIVFIANPNNPTGTWLGARSLEAFLSDVPAHVLVVIDEAYFEYAHALRTDLNEYPDCIQWVNRYPHLIVMRTFSKIYGLAGLRIGYAVSNTDMAELLNRVRQPFNLNSVAQAAALAALDDDEHLEKSVKLNQEGMQQYEQAFNEMGLSFIPSAANFICVDLGHPAVAVYEALLKEGIIVRPVANYGLPQHLRITIGLPDENTRTIKALKIILSNK